MHFARILLLVALCALTSCAQLGGLKVGVCYEGVCANVELPKNAPVRESGKEVEPVQ